MFEPPFMVLVIQLDLPACRDNVRRKLIAAHYLNRDHTKSNAKHLPIKRHENVASSIALRYAYENKQSNFIALLLSERPGCCCCCGKCKWSANEKCRGLRRCNDALADPMQLPYVAFAVRYPADCRTRTFEAHSLGADQLCGACSAGKRSERAGKSKWFRKRISTSCRYRRLLSPRHIYSHKQSSLPIWQWVTRTFLTLSSRSNGMPVMLLCINSCNRL